MDRTGLTDAQVLVALYNGSRCQGLGFLQAKPGGLTVEGAEVLLGGIRNEPGQPTRGSYFDYLHGRVIKTDVSENPLDLRLYDRDMGGRVTGASRAPVANFGGELASTGCSLCPGAIRGLVHYHVKMGTKHKRQPPGCRGRVDRRGRLRARPGACLSPQPNKLENPRGSSPVSHLGVCEAGRCGGFDIASWWKVAETPPLIGPVPGARGDDRGARHGGVLDPGSIPGASTNLMAWRTA